MVGGWWLLAPRYASSWALGLSQIPSAACLDCPAMSAGTLIINGPLRDPRHRSCSNLPTYETMGQKVGP